MQEMAHRQHEHNCNSLLDLPENLIISILRYLPVETKCRAELVCRTFRELLSNPTQGEFVWGTLALHGQPFDNVDLSVLNRQAFLKAITPSIYGQCQCHDIARQGVVSGSGSRGSVPIWCVSRVHQKAPA